jgi:hypothetical protein
MASMALGIRAFSAALLFLGLQRCNDALPHRFSVGRCRPVSVKNGRMLMRLPADLSHRIVSDELLGCAPPVYS